MIVSDIFDCSLNAGLIIRGYNSGYEYANTVESGTGDVDLGLIPYRIVSISVENSAVVLMIED